MHGLPVSGPDVVLQYLGVAFAFGFGGGFGVVLLLLVLVVVLRWFLQAIKINIIKFLFNIKTA